ncbi:integrase [Cucumis melo var. makuwa]|uniref:Integrase n=1 Tax=Cucumis melo var. makuwa TaxID=1194695 RepID=A0A5D3CWH6_CUCMM|nr:integrase [Cucumis melo var. makuwa]
MNDYEVVALTQATSDFFKKGVRKKMTNRGRFTVPCSIGGMDLGRALCDLGASINLMSLSIFKKLGIGEVQPTQMVPQFANRSISRPEDKIEDVLVKVDKFFSHRLSRIVLGHKIFHAGLEVDLAKIDVVSMLPSLFDLKTLRSFLGHAGIYHRFLKVPILITLIGRKPFELMCDASDVVIGAMLDRIGIENQVADHLSCLSNAPFQRKKKEITDCFFDKQLFAVEGKELCTLWRTLSRIQNGCKGTDFIGPFSQSGGHLYILLDMDYVSKWVEAISNVKIDVITVHFINHIITKLLVMYNINHKVATANKPQTNGQVDVCNREIKILEKVVNSSLKDLADHLDSTLLAYCTAYKTPIGMSPYALVFGKACHLPRELECKKLWACKKLNFNNRVQERLDYFSCTSFRNDIFKPLRTPKSIKKRQRHCTISTFVNTIAPWKESITL